MEIYAISLMNLPIDKEYNNIYSFSKLSEQDIDEDRIKQHLYYDYTRVNGFQQLSSNDIEKTINLGFDLELYINYDAVYSEIIKYNYCVLQDKKLGTNNQHKKYFYFISNIKQSNSAGKYRITLKYDYWSNNIASIYLNNFDNTFNFVRRTNSPKYFPITTDKLYIEANSDYKLSAVQNKLPLISKRTLGISFNNNYQYVVIFAKIFLKGLSDKKYYKCYYNVLEQPNFEDFSCDEKYLSTQFVLMPVAVYNVNTGEILDKADFYAKTPSFQGDGTNQWTEIGFANAKYADYKEYIDFIELTTIVPFIDGGYLESVNEDTNKFYFNSYFSAKGLASSENTILTEVFFLIPNFFYICSCSRKFDFLEGNIEVDYSAIPKIINYNDIRKFVVETNRYPYKYKGLQIGSSSYDFFSGHGKSTYYIEIKGTGLGYTLKYNVKVGDKELNPKAMGNFASKDVFYLPYYGDKFSDFMIGNKNQLESAVSQSVISGGVKSSITAITSALLASSGVISPMIGITGTIASAASSITNIINTQNSVEGKISDAQNLLNELKGNTNGLTSLFTVNIPMFFEADTFDYEDTNADAFDIYTKGSKYNGISNLKDIVIKGKYYNYIQTNIEILPFNSVDKISLAELTNIFNKGVRIWNINEAEYTKGSSSEIFIDETFATMNLLIFNYREKEN